jgi:hypothetical protein
MIVIEIRPHPWSWKVFKAPGVEPVFPEKRQAIHYAQFARASAPVKFVFSILLASSNARLRSTRRIECCDPERSRHVVLSIVLDRFHVLFKSPHPSRVLP